MLLAAIAPVFILVLAGFLIRRIGVLTAEADVSLLRVSVNFLYPCLIVSTVIGNNALHQSINVWFPPLVGFVTVAAGYLISWLGARVLRVERGKETRTFSFVTGLYNYGYAAIPVVGSLFGAKALGVLFTHNLGVEIGLWLGAGLILASHPDRTGWRRVINAPVVAVVGSVALNFMRGGEPFPPWLFNSLAMAGASAIPLALLLTGATLSDFLAEAAPSGSDAAALTGACLLRLGLIPLLFLAMARWLPCSTELKQVLVIQAAMPAAMLPVVLAKHYGGDVGLAVQIVLVTTVLSLATMPYWVQFGLRFVGL